jgi:hypothetical protein
MTLDDGDETTPFGRGAAAPIRFAVALSAVAMLPFPPREGEGDDDDDEDNKPRRSLPTPSGRKMHHVTHATRLRSTVLFIVRVMPPCIEHIRPMVQFNKLLPAFILSLLLPERKLARNCHRPWRTKYR